MIMKRIMEDNNRDNPNGNPVTIKNLSVIQIDQDKTNLKRDNIKIADTSMVERNSKRRTGTLHEWKGIDADKTNGELNNRYNVRFRGKYYGQYQSKDWAAWANNLAAMKNKQEIGEKIDAGGLNDFEEPEGFKLAPRPEKVDNLPKGICLTARKQYKVHISASGLKSKNFKLDESEKAKEHLKILNEIVKEKDDARIQEIQNSEIERIEVP
ncbi:hypothetical protein BDK51DRAFT_40448 [Blyttiomyces helicus]|uniref:Uncharacterized protein n=1 Tax=Blyttiomyces helicus TaxID=388810 RepID=A0A4P9WEP2_9FUNG|nr:hypothetical protein BDK51DRAFT_40448 [Blyttiomyces helicus]|eukprot:RKO89460.1 hypothetical protein BDK51DRAFT_40448 [Blyttiomyces helicus]